MAMHIASICRSSFKLTVNEVLSPRLVCRYISTSPSCYDFFQRSRKGHSRYDRQWIPLRDQYEVAKKMGPILKQECKLFIEEMKEKFLMDQKIIRPGDSEFLWRFNDPDILNKFVVSCDKDFNEGFSECELIVNEKNKGVFRGNLNCHLPKDGRIVRTGYCNFSTRRAKESFFRNTYWVWCPYNHLILKVRGDGRPYMINISCEGEFDLTWSDMWNYILFTRGGPYWQVVKIPFSRFYLANRGRIQDKQEALPSTRITRFGITLADKAPGPFQLEVDYVGLYFDPSHTEEFAYEMYQTPKYVVS